MLVLATVWPDYWTTLTATGPDALEDRYLAAPPPARAILQVAMDAHRLGHPLALPHALLERAASGYLDDHDWNACGEDWLEAALAYTAQPCSSAHPQADQPEGGQEPARWTKHI